MNKEFIPYQEALALKELGFDELCFAYWNADPYLPKPFFNLVKPFEHEWCIPAPLYYQSFRWFREKYALDSFCRQGAYNGNSYYKISKIETDERIKGYSKFTKTYEEAELACLKKLIEIAKDKVKLV